MVMRAITGALAALTVATYWWKIHRRTPTEEAHLHLSPDPNNPLKPTPAGLRLLSLVDVWDQSKDKARGSLSPANWLLCDNYAKQLQQIRALPTYNANPL